MRRKNSSVSKKPEFRPAIQIAKHLRAPTTQIEDIVRKAHLNYDDTCKVMSEVRRRLEIIRPGRRKLVIDHLSSIEADRFLRVAYADTYGLLLQTLFQTGASTSEVIAIRTKDFHPKDVTIIIRKDKGHRKHIVPVLPELARALQAHVGDRTAGWLFETNRTKAYSARRVQQIIAVVARKARITKTVHPHLLRPYVARQLLKGGMPLGQIETFLGCKKIESARTYMEATREMVRKAYVNEIGSAGVMPTERKIIGQLETLGFKVK
jgi:integrase